MINTQCPWYLLLPMKVKNVIKVTTYTGNSKIQEIPESLTITSTRCKMTTTTFSIEANHALYFTKLFLQTKNLQNKRPKKTPKMTKILTKIPMTKIWPSKNLIKKTKGKTYNQRNSPNNKKTINNPNRLISLLARKILIPTQHWNRIINRKPRNPPPIAKNPL